MSNSRSPQHVLERLMRGIADRAWDGLDQLYAEDTVVDHPFALPAPRRTEGRAAIREHFAAFAAAPLRLEVRNWVVHLTADPEVAIAEWDYEGVVTTTGRTFRVSNVQVSGVRDGRIVASRDYHNHALMAAVMGRTAPLINALEALAAQGRPAQE
jgi:ketosteroid isomerase-like protein